MKKIIFLFLFFFPAFVYAQGNSPTPTNSITIEQKDCTGISVVAWEQDPNDVVEYWQLYVGSSPLEPWPKSECTPLPTPNQWEHPMPIMPVSPFYLIACNSDGCSDPSNVRICVTSTPTPTMTATATPTSTATATHTATPVPTRTKKPKPIRPHWLDWLWR